MSTPARAPGDGRPDARFPFTPGTAAWTGGAALVLLTVGLMLPQARDTGIRLQFAIGAADRVSADGLAGDELVRQTVEAAQRRVRQLGARDLRVTPGPAPDRISVECRGASTSAVAALLGSRGRLGFSLVEDGPVANPETLLSRRGGKLLPHLWIVPAISPGGANPSEFYLVRSPAITGSDIETARPTLDEFNKPAVTLRLRPDAVAKMSALTRANVGGMLAIVLDDRVTSAPVIQEAIATREVRITGAFTQDEVNTLAMALRSGSLPRALHLVEERELPAEPGFRGGKIVLLGAGGLAAALALLLFLGYATDRRAVHRAMR
jgi:protein-export membrane protein SecD